jgi:nucleotide-binding universal stress UspA family protein
MDIHVQPGSIVCGFDGSADATRALHWSAAQASLERRPLAIVSAAGLDQVGALTWAGAAGTLVIPTDELVERVTAVAESAAASVRLHRPDLEVGAHAAPGDPRDVLTRMSEHAHLVVLGSRGRGALRSRFLGSVSTTVTRHARCPVVVCRPESAGRVRKGVLVGVDGTPESHPVLDFAFRAASERELPLTVLHAFHDVLAAVSGPHVVLPSEEGLVEERLLVAESLAGFAAKYPDVHLDTRLARGFPDDCLAADSERWHLIVVGRHPTDTLSRTLSPTVATAVVERARTTVAVVPVPAPAF